ncbi:hypothetical protein [Streptosporangium lutulentum]|uniref:Uncharacterized protein n=1 Tax=Streptosporangium lutulentum TaxID=1461250 RepID=A0ABT9QUL7_9ACTN|nr:hypothetical protein [Streptosporangium lutulentum]MDP9850465.1 hypothetical protein [Streptosporangium lutulentum]
MSAQAPWLGHICERATSVAITAMRGDAAGVRITMASSHGVEPALLALHRHGYAAYIDADGSSDIASIRVLGWSHPRVLARINHLRAALRQLHAGHRYMAEQVLARTFAVPDMRRLPTDFELAASLLTMAGLIEWLSEQVYGAR